MIRLGLCDDDPVVTELLVRMLSSSADVEVVSICSSGEEAIEAADSVLVDVWLMDLRLPGISGLDTCQVLLSRKPQPKVVFLTALEDRAVAMRMRSGASGYLFKDGTSENLVNAVRAVAAGYSVGSPEAMSQLVRPETEVLDAIGRLSHDDLDRELMLLVLAGHDYREIASRLFLSESALKKRVGAITRRAGVTSRHELMAKLNAPRW